MADELQGYKSRFLPLPVDAYDLGIDLVLPRDALRLYEHVRRFVQRKNFKKDKAVEKRVYADIKQSVLADRIGHNRQWVNKTIGMLEELGWLKRSTIEANPHGQKRYFLGTRSEDHEETFWADKKLEEYRRHICKTADVKFSDFGDLGWDDRVGLLKKLLKPVLGTVSDRGVSSRQDRGVSQREDRGVSSPQDRGCLAGETGGVLPARQGVSSPQDTLNRTSSNTQFSKRQFSNNRVRVANAPASASGSGDFSDHEPPPPDSAGDTADHDSDHDQSSAENSDSEASREVYRAWLDSDADADEVVDEDGERVESDEGDESDEESTDVNDTEARLARGAQLTKEAVEKAKATRAANEARRSKLAKHKQLEKNLTGPNLERYIPKGSVKRMERVWLKAFDEHYPDFTPAKWWTQRGEKDDGSPKLVPGKESGLVSQLVQMYSPDQVEKYLKWAVANWATIQTRFKNVPPVPAINFLYGFRETLLPEAVMGNAAEQVEADLHAWYAEHPNEDIPAELSARVKALKGKG